MNRKEMHSEKGRPQEVCQEIEKVLDGPSLDPL